MAPEKRTHGNLPAARSLDTYRDCETRNPHQKKLLFSLQNCHGRRVVVRVAEAEVKSRAAAPLEKLLAAVVQNDERLARFLAADFHVLPAELFANARAEGFGDGFLGREPGRQKRRRVPVREAIGDFRGPQNAVQKPLAEFPVGSGDACHFDDIDAGAQDHWSFRFSWSLFAKSVLFRSAVSYPRVVLKARTLQTGSS